jgi:hypothetical protein
MSVGFTGNHLDMIPAHEFLAIFRFAIQNPLLVAALKFGRPLVEIAD